MLGRFYKWLVGFNAVKAFIGDLSSLRAIWNWIMLTTFIGITVYCVAIDPSTRNTAIMTMGGVASAIFTGYVFTRPTTGQWVDPKRVGFDPTKEEEGGLHDKK